MACASVREPIDAVTGLVGVNTSVLPACGMARPAPQPLARVDGGALGAPFREPHGIKDYVEPHGPPTKPFRGRKGHVTGQLTHGRRCCAFCSNLYNTDHMDHKISATELARRLGDVLGRVRYRGDSFLVERSGTAVARLVPVPGASAGSVREALLAWRAAGTPDAEFAEILERVGATDRPPEDAWAS